VHRQQVHLAYTAEWKGCELLWKIVIKMKGLSLMLLLLETLLTGDTKAGRRDDHGRANRVSYQ
jgi:hypothetical protein